MAVIRIKEILDPDQAAPGSRAITQTFDRLGRRVFTRQDLLRLIGKHREDWQILDRVPPKKIIDYLLTAFPLRKIVLAGPDHSQEFNRYLWREANPLEVAASVRAPNSYLCHSSALFMHGLVDTFPKELCVNYEQSAKPKPLGASLRTQYIRHSGANSGSLHSSSTTQNTGSSYSAGNIQATWRFEKCPSTPERYA